MRSFRVILPLVLLSLAVIAAGAACGDDDDDDGGDTLTMNAYFDRFAEIGNGAQDDVLAIPDDTEDVDALHQIADIFGGAADDLDDVNAPDDVSDVHDGIATKTRELSEAFDALADAANTEGEEAAGQTWQETLTEWGEACTAVLDAGEAQGITVDVDCSVGE